MLTVHPVQGKQDLPRAEAMNNTKKTQTDPVRAFLAAIGSKGGSAGSRADKVKAARTRWDKAKAHAKADTGHTPSQAQR